MTCDTTIKIKRGATFAANCLYTPAPGGLPDLEGADITSQVRQHDELIEDLEVELASDGLSFTVNGGLTDDWPIDYLAWDIRIEINGAVYFTDTVQLQVVLNVTEAVA